MKPSGVRLITVILMSLLPVLKLAQLLAYCAKARDLSVLVRMSKFCPKQQKNTRYYVLHVCDIIC